MNNNIKRSGMVAVAMLGCLGLAVSAQGASFDCGKAGTKGEHIICDDAKRNIAVTISADVQQQLKKLSPNERKRVESAIAAGNRFIPFYLDGSYYLIVDEQWVRKIRPLVNKNAEAWYAMLNNNASGVELEISKREATNLISICPQVELIQIEFLQNLVALKYRSRVVNVHKLGSEASDLADLILDDSVDYQEVEFGIDDKLVDFVRPKYFGTFGATSSYIDAYRSLIQEELREAQHVPPVEQIEINEKIYQHEKWIKVFQEQEAAICRTR